MLFPKIQTLPEFRDVVELYAGHGAAWYRARVNNSNELSESVAAGDGVLLRAMPGISHSRNSLEDRVTQSRSGETAIWMRVLRVLDHGDFSICVYEDPGGVPIRGIMENKKFDLPSFLKVAEQLTALLVQVHEPGLAHGGSLADHIFYDVAHSEIALAEFGVDGREPIPVQQAADLRSLGHLFYEMLHGAPADELLRPLALLHPGFPGVVSGIIEKLLSSESPYRTMAGLYPDLKSCAQQLEVFKSIQDFVPGRLDRPLSRA